MREPDEESFPPLIELHHLVRQRAPHLAWPLARLAAVLSDLPEVNWRMVAGRCLDYISERKGVRDGPRTLRTFMEREQRWLDQHRETPGPPEPKPDIYVGCPSCGRSFNISAETRRPDRDLVSVCADCFQRPREERDGDPSHEEEPRPGQEARKLRAV